VPARYALGAAAHARGMDARSRCRACRKYLHAEPRKARQKVCSAACRLVWRRRQAKQRRERDLEGHREADRARQQAWREARRAATGPPESPRGRVTPPTSSRRVTPPSPRALSRAGIASQPHGTKEEILLAWDKAARLSRAGLAQDLAKILGEDAPILGQAGQDRGPVTRREGGVR
jgi:hypothetical protein